jgi:hypothetical protein
LQREAQQPFGDIHRRLSITDGWSFTVTTDHLMEIWYAHIEDQGAAEEAIKQRPSAISKEEVKVRTSIPHNVLLGMNIPEGEIGQAIHTG